MVRVSGMALYGSVAASTRYRMSQFVPGLSQLGIEVDIQPLLDDAYLQARYQGRAVPVGSLLRSGVSRIRALRKPDACDVLMVYGELFPLMPACLEQSLMRQPFIYDFDDAFYLKYQSGRMRLLRPVLGRKFEQVIAAAAAVTAGNRTLQAYAAPFHANSHVLPTVVDTARYQPDLTRRGGSGVLTVGWIGSPSTAPYLQGLVTPLRQLAMEGAVRLVVIGGKAPRIDGVDVVELPWSEDTEIDLINTFDVGIMPLPDDAWARGKCAFKLIQYMACGVPVIASPVGANCDVVTPECGLLASTDVQWLQAFQFMRDQPVQRARMGDAGRERIVAHYSLHQHLPRLAEIIHQVARKK
jgi:glycosyltransferase involved in cell wall biosynthesis